MDVISQRCNQFFKHQIGMVTRKIILSDYPASDKRNLKKYRIFEEKYGIWKP